MVFLELRAHRGGDRVLCRPAGECVGEAREGRRQLGDEVAEHVEGGPRIVLAEDGGERVWKDLDLSAFITSGTQAQRLAKIELLSTRQGLTVEATFKLTAWAAMTGRTVALTNTRFGWSSKAFDVLGSRFTISPINSLR